MEIMTKLKKSFMCLLIITLCLVYCPAISFSQPLSVEDFSTLPMISSVKLSPDGEKVIFFQNAKGNTYLRSLYLKTGKKKVIAAVDNIKYKFRYAMWANNETVIYSIIVPDYRGGVAISQTRLLVRKADTSDEPRELVKPGSAGGDDPTRPSQFQDNIISMLPDDPDHILMGLDSNRPNLDSVYKININTSKLTEIQKAMEDVRDWGADQQDRVRIGIKFNPYTTTITTVIYDLVSKEWREAWQRKALSDEREISPMGFGLDPNILYVRAEHDGRNAIFKVDVSNAEMPMEIIAKDDKYDINGNLIYSRQTRDVVGVYHDEADGKRIYWDKKYKDFQEAVDKALPDTVNYLIDFSIDEQRYIVYSTNDRTPGKYYFGDKEHDTLTIIAHTYSQLEDNCQGSKKITYTARDGKTIEAYLTLPANHTPGTPCPAIIFPHGGPMVRDYGDFDYWAEFFASKGIVVMKPNFRGSSGYGKDFEREALQNFGLTMQDDLTDAANWLIEQKLADPQRIAITGGSYGGYAALMGAVKTPDLFRCAISFAGISDLPGLLKASQPFLNYGVVQKQLGTDKKKLKEVSPITHIKKIKIPILLGHGDEDRTVPVEQSQKMAKALKKKKKEFTYVELENGDHSLSLQKNRHIFFRAMDEFLDKYLLN